MIKKIIRSIFPERTRARLKSYLFIPGLLWIEMKRAIKVDTNETDSRYYEMRRLIHRVEKNLIIPKRRLLSGYPTVSDIMDLLAQDSVKSTLDQSTLDWALSVLDQFQGQVEYDLVHGDENQKEAAVKIQASLKEFLTAQKKEASKFPLKQMPEDSELIPSKETFDFLEKIARLRCSVRQFSEKDVTESHIENALEIARNYPSACNRQGVGITVIQNKALQKKILQLQAGMSGFQNEIPLLVLISFTNSAYPSYSERHTGYLETGLFSMGFIWGLLSQGIYSTALNWSYRTAKMNDELHKLAELDKSHEVVFLLAAGFPGEEGKIPSSPKKYANDFIIKKL